MEKNNNNNVHLHGFINDLYLGEIKDTNKVAVIVRMNTKESFKDETGEKVSKPTFHKVKFVTEDKALIDNLRAIQKDLQDNKDNKENESYKPSYHRLLVDGHLALQENTSEAGVKYYNPIILANADNIKLDAEKDEKNVHNRGEFKGNIVKIDLHDDFAVVRIATKRYAPGESVNYKGEKKPYKEVPTFIDTRVSGSYRPETFKKLQNGEIEVGDLISCAGQLHNNDYKDKNDIYRSNIAVDLNSMDVLYKKGSKEAVAEAKANGVEEAAKPETKQAAKTEKKAAPKRKKGVTM